MNAPAFQLYADDFLGGTADMTAEEVGAYIRLLCHQWNKGALPPDDSRLLIMAGLTQPLSIAFVKTKFRPGPDGLLRNDRLESERAKQVAYRAKQAENGAKGGRPMKAKPNPSLSFGLSQTKAKKSSPSPSPSTVPPTPKLAFVKPTLDEVTSFCRDLQLPDSDAESFYWGKEANGWMNGKAPIKNWQATIRNWKASGFLPSQKQRYDTTTQTHFRGVDRKKGTVMEGKQNPHLAGTPAPGSLP